MVKLIDFFATWCGPCKMMEPVFTELKQELAGRVEFEKVDVDSDPVRAGQFRVMSVPTFVLEKDGREVARTVGYHAKEDLKTWIESNSQL